VVCTACVYNCKKLPACLSDMGRVAAAAAIGDEVVSLDFACTQLLLSCLVKYC